MTDTASRYGRFYQLGYVTRNLDKGIAHLQRRMGAQLIDIIRELRDEAGSAVALQNVAHLALPGVEIEVMEPRIDWPSIYLEALPASDDDVGFHHLGFIVPDSAAWDRAVESLDAQDTPIVMQGGTAQVRFAYIDTRKQMGHYSEIAQRFSPPLGTPPLGTSAAVRPLPT